MRKHNYIYSDNLLSKLEEGNIKYIESVENIEDSSNILYIPSNDGFKYYEDENDLYSFLVTSDDIREYKNKYSFKEIFKNKLYLTDLVEKFYKEYKIAKNNKNIKLVNIISVFKYIYENVNVFENEYISNVFIFKINNDEAVSIIVKNEKENGIYIDSIQKNTIQDIQAAIIEYKNKNLRLGILTNVYINFETEESFSNEFNLKVFNKLVREYEEEKWFKEYLRSIENEKLYIKIDFDIYNTIDKINETEIVNIYEYYNQIKNKKKRTYILISLIFLTFAGINYYIHFPMLEQKKQKYDQVYKDLKENLKNLEMQRLKIESKKKFSQIKQTYGKEWTVLPYLYTYLTHYNIKIEKVEIAYNKQNKTYYGNFYFFGDLPEKVLAFLKYNMGMENFDILKSATQFKKGNKYVITFNLKKVYNKLKAGGIIND